LAPEIEVQEVRMIEAKNLVRRYGDFAAVDDVSFSIAAGEVVGLLSHNGAGKTTIMKMLTGFLEPTSGSVLVDGIDVFAEPSKVQAQMGYLPESSPLYPELTVVDYLAYAAQLRGLEPQSCVAQAIAATQLESKALDPIHTLSRGFKQRVGVAQAILHKPRFLILDEPSNGLDPTQTQHMRELIRTLAESATVILSTHIMQEVNAVCDRAMILRAGKLAVDERLDELQKTSSVLLQTAAEVDVSSLLSGVSEVGNAKAVDATRWNINLTVDSAAGAAAIAQALVSAGAPIHALNPQVRDLETIFNEVSEGVEAGVQHAA
jgi:ABC-2 type transport system ATP-binding protein